MSGNTGSDQADGKNHKRVIQNLSRFIDSNLREIKYAVYGFAAAGTILIFRSLHPFVKFSRVEKIPNRYIQKNVTLRGQVTKIGNDGAICVNHFPLVILPWKRHDVGELPLELAFVVVSPQARIWLRNNVLNKNVWFQLIYSTAEHKLGCSVFMKKGTWRKIHVNEELVKIGLSKICGDVEAQISSKQHLELLKILIRHESTAQKKGIGLWAAESPRSLSAVTHSLLTTSSSVMQKLQHLLATVVKYLTLIGRKGRKENGT